MRGFFASFTIALGVGALALAACGDDDTGTTPKADSGTPDVAADTAPTSDVAISINMAYSGAKQGPAIVSVWPTAAGPATGGLPSGTGSNEKPTWPGTNVVQVKNVNPGHYFIYGYVMVGSEHRQGPIQGDPSSSAPVEVDVVAGQTATVTVNIDGECCGPPPGDGGTDSASDAPSDAPDDG